MFFKIILKLTILTTLTRLNSCYDCDDVKSNELILNSLDGKLRGKCEDIYVYYSNKKKNTNIPILSWLSVPYAEPPIGDLRFKNSIPIQPWSNQKLATKMPKTCIQHHVDYTNKMSEDCLYLNIYSPYESYQKSVTKKINSELLPVLVWIHGGGFVVGSASEYEPQMLAATQNIIVVTINYRLNIFGFLNLDNTEAKGHQGFLDQHLALKWIYENAAKYGGDKNKITISGESAGSWSIGYHMLYKPSWPYFNQGLMQSGVPTRLDVKTLLLTPEEAKSATLKLINDVNCGGKKTNIETLKCLQLVDYKIINKKATNYLSFPTFILRKDLFNEHPRNLIQRGEVKKCNIFIGYTTHEELSLAESEVDEYIQDMKNGNFKSFKTALKERLTINDDQLKKIIDYYVSIHNQNNNNVDYFMIFVDMISDFQYKCPTNTFADYYSKYYKDIYVFLYGHRASNSKEPYVDGAAHAEEITMMLGEPLYTSSKFSSDEKLFAEQIMNYWGSFVKYGRPTLNNDWPKYADTDVTTNKNLFFLKMNQNMNTLYNIENEKCKFWDSLNIVTWKLNSIN